MTRAARPRPGGGARAARTAAGPSLAFGAFGAVVALAALAATVACRAPQTATQAHASGSATPAWTATGLTAPPGTTLVEACTPTGPELCFNAIDDNCNGVIDEGCGVSTGVLQFTIAWTASAANVDLAVTTPGHERVPSERSTSTASGFHLDHDCPGDDGCGGQNVENVYFDGADPPKGHYAVEVALVDPHGADPPIQVRFGARLGSRTVGFDVALTPGEGAKKTFSFDLP